MKRLVSPGRVAVLAVFMGVLLIIYIGTMYKLQVVQGNEYYEQSQNSIVTEESVIAARGSILDRYGRVLVSNRNCNNLMIDTTELYEQTDDPNAAILQMCSIVLANGDTYTDELPITMTPPFEYVDNMSELQRMRLNAWLDANGLDYDATAVEVLAQMRSRYDIDNNYTAEEMRIIAGVRYETNIRYIINTSDYVYAQDVSIDTITALMEADIPGFEVQVSYIREYHTEYAAHILGYTGLMNETEYETYKDQGYQLNATVGKSGVELAFESYLHGTDGTAAVTRTSDGVVTGTVYTQTPEPGNHVYLTIDIEMQGVAEQALASFIESTNETRQIANDKLLDYEKDEEQALITGGAVVVVDVNSGEPLVIASYPTYSLDTFLDDYSELVENTETTPLLNRALNGAYAPGSTFKPITALTALNEGLIGEDSSFSCSGIYEKYASQGYSPRCTGVHGTLTVTDAITVSCNLFFYQVGDITGIDLIDEYADAMGLGEYTGIELGESKGHVASVEYKNDLYAGQLDADWYVADTLQAAIGQSITGVTPIQLARYCAALANNGTVYNCSVLKSVSSYDYSESIFERTPSVYGTVDASDVVWSLIRTGMIGVANDRSGTAYDTFKDYTPTVAAKTGTSETGSGSDDAVFICYAPADDPEIAIAIVAENGAHGSNLAVIAKQILDYYFAFEESTTQLEDELTILG